MATFTGLDDNPTYTEDAPQPVVLDDDATVVNAAASYDGTTLTLARDGGANPDDVFGGGGTLTLDEGQVLLQETVDNDTVFVAVGTYTNADGTLAITFNANATQARVNAVLEQITYGNGSNGPPPFVIIDFTFDDGVAPATGSVRVDITGTNDPPSLGSVNPTAAYQAGSPGVVLSPNVSIGDVDSTNLAGATVQITDGIAGDVLSANPGGTGITVSYDPGTFTLTLGGTGTLDEYRQVLDTVAYSSTSSDPGNAGNNPLRSVTWELNDGGASNNLSDPQVTTVQFSPTPIGGGPFSVLENSPNGTVVGSVSSSDPGFQSISYSLADDAGGRFAINPSSGQITVANGVLLDYEQGGGHSITVRAADSEGFFVERTFTVSVGDVNPENAAGSSQGETMVGGPLGDRFTSLGGSDVLIGGGGNDTLLAGDGSDYVSGGDGNDHIVGGAGYQSLNGDAGNDYMDGGGDADGFFGGDGNDTMVGGNGADYMVGGADDDQLHGRDGDDTMFGDAGNDLLNGGNGNNAMFGGIGNDTLNGGNNSDYMVGGDGNDELYGGLGDDQFFAGAGSDIIYTGQGRDQLVYNAGDGPEFVADFDVVNDVINLSSLAGIDTFQDVLNRSRQVGGNTVIDFGGGDVLTLSNVQLSTLQSSDFYL
jgi:hypothetical protein